MCGLLGGWFFQTPPSLKKTLTKAMHELKHRGPDDNAYEIYPSTEGDVVLGHTRLSIIDLSYDGHQPMHSTDGRFVIVFNGEIYNYRELKKELQEKGYFFQSNSDTEVLLTAWREWGATCLPRLLGMFAFVIYDKQAQTLTCVRDAFGIKPFFYRHCKDSFLFASEQPALKALSGETVKIDWQRSYDFLVYGDYDSQERTFYEGISHLLPGQMFVFDIKTATLSTPVAWWSPTIREHSRLTFSQATETVREQFLQMVRLHLRSDVPIGAALSGGVDSSAVVCAMRYLEPDCPIHTFSFIAKGTALSEEPWIDRINQHVKAIPYKVVATQEDLIRDLDDMISAQGEPFGSTSIYAQYRVFKLVRDANVTVTLDGQGADELLAGYHGYPGERLLSYIEQGEWWPAIKFLHQWKQWPGRRYRDGLMNLGRVVLPDSLYQHAGKWVGRHAYPDWLNISMLRDAGVNLQEIRIPLDREGMGRRVIERLASSLQMRGLPALLRHADRNAMRFSIESRVPFLTIPFADLLLSLPEKMLISDKGETKHIFRAAMRGIVPDDILNRRDKIGFATPEKDWLLGMAPIVRVWLKQSHTVPFLNQDALLSQFDAVVAGKAKFSWQLWRWINFVRWYQKVADNK